MRNRNINIFSKIVIVLILTLMVFSPSLLVSKASSYNYDFWKNVIPSAEGLAYQETYYGSSIDDINGKELKDKISFDTLADMAVYKDKIYVLDTNKNTSTVLQNEQTINNKKYQKIEAKGVSTVYVLNQNFQKVEALNEFVISDDVLHKLQDFYQFYLEGAQLTPEHYSSTELVTFYQTTDYEHNLLAGKNEFVVKEELYTYATYAAGVFTYSSDDIEVVLVDSKGKETLVPRSEWVWDFFNAQDGEPCTEHLYVCNSCGKNDEVNEECYNHNNKIVCSKCGIYENVECSNHIDADFNSKCDTCNVKTTINYKIVLDEKFVSSENTKVITRYKKTTNTGKAPYFTYSKDPSKYAIRLNNAEGITVTKDGLFIADTGNSRVIRCNQNADGEWVVDGVYLTPNDTIFYQVSEAIVEQLKINDATASKGVKAFKPQKIAVDKTGRLYAIASGVYEGIMEFHTSGMFNRFLGKNEVVANPLKKFWSKIFSETQIAGMTKDLPSEFTNIAMDPDGFLFATSYPDADATTNANLVKMINTSGKDILKRNGYVTPDGDAVYLQSTTEDGVIVGMSQLVGVTVSENGNFTVVDELRGRLFTYDNEGNLLYITGEQPGGNAQAGSTTLSNCIIDPVAIRYFTRDSGEVDNNGNALQEEILLVLDASSKSIILYQTTEFGEAVNTATGLYQKGIVEDIYKTDEDGNILKDENGEPIVEQYGAETYWRQVVKMNTNYELAYLGIGKALLRRGEYKEAMEYFTLAHNATYYSKAYAEYRDIILSNNFNWIMTAVILLVVLWITMTYRNSLKRKNLALAARASMNEEKARMIRRTTAILQGEKYEEEVVEEVVEETREEEKSVWKKILEKVKLFFNETWKHPLYILSHPVQGWEEFKIEKKGKMWVSIFILLMYVLMNIVAYQYEGIITNTNNPQKFNSIQLLIYGVLPPVIIAVANWSVTTLLDGKGKMKEIFMMICYSLFPVTILGFLNIGLSNVLTLDEANFIMLINIVSWVLTCYMAFMGLVVIHEYGIAKTLWSIILTVVAMLIIAFVALLLFDLAQQMYGFIYSLFKEISTRFF